MVRVAVFFFIDVDPLQTRFENLEEPGEMVNVFSIDGQGGFLDVYRGPGSRKAAGQ